MIKDFVKNINTFKQELKNYAEFIRAYKKDEKLEQQEANKGKCVTIETNRNDLFKKLKWIPENPGRSREYYHRVQYRHMHIAYAMLRGRTMKQIENTVADGNEPDTALINKYAFKYMGIKNLCANADKIRRAKPVVKMYVLIREDMEPKNRMVQGGHAVAQFLLEHKDEQQNWRNGYMIYLGIKDEAALKKWEEKLKEGGIPFSTFTETDWGDPTNTALACIDVGDIFAKLPLLDLEPLKKVA